MPLYQALIHGTLVAFAMWDLDRLHYVGPWSPPLRRTYVSATLLPERSYGGLAYKSTYIVSIGDMRLQARDITVKVSLARLTAPGAPLCGDRQSSLIRRGAALARRSSMGPLSPRPPSKVTEMRALMKHHRLGATPELFLIYGWSSMAY